MRTELIPAEPLGYNPYDIDCCGSHAADKLVVHCDYKERLKINIQEFKSGIGPSYAITAVDSETGVECKGKLWVYIDDDGELNFYMKVDK